MTSLSCQKCQSSFSAYLDGDVSGKLMQKIARHLKDCADCRQDFASLRATQRMISSVGQAKAPADLGLRLRLAISHEHSRRKSSWIDTVTLKWENAFRPLLLQVSAGFAGAFVLVGSIAVLLGLFAAPEPVM